MYPEASLQYIPSVWYSIAILFPAICGMTEHNPVALCQEMMCSHMDTTLVVLHLMETTCILYKYFVSYSCNHLFSPHRSLRGQSSLWWLHIFIILSLTCWLFVAEVGVCIYTYCLRVATCVYPVDNSDQSSTGRRLNLLLKGDFCFSEFYLYGITSPDSKLWEQVTLYLRFCNLHPSSTVHSE